MNCLTFMVDLLDQNDNRTSLLQLNISYVRYESQTSQNANLDNITH